MIRTTNLKIVTLSTQVLNASCHVKISVSIIVANPGIVCFVWGKWFVLLYFTEAFCNYYI